MESCAFAARGAFDLGALGVVVVVVLVVLIDLVHKSNVCVRPCGSFVAFFVSLLLAAAA